MNRAWHFISNLFHRTERETPAVVEQEWDAEDNSVQDSPIISFDLNTAIDSSAAGSSIYITPDNGTIISNSIINVDDRGYTIESDPAFMFQLTNGDRLSVKMTEDRNGLELDIDPNIYTPEIVDGKIIIRKQFDEENNASQDIGTHEESTEDDSHSGENVLQPGLTVQYTQV